MKIALALSGLTRIHAISAASWGRIIGKYQPDVYIHSWCLPADMSVIYDQLGWVFKPKQILLEEPISIDTAPYPDRHWPYINVDRSLSMWHSICRAYSMVIEHDVNYDIIIRGRMDWHVHSLDLIDHDGIVLPYDRDKIPLKFNYNGNNMHGLNDHFAYGSPKWMKCYTNTLALIPQLYSQEGVDYCPENFLAASLAKQHVPVMLQNLEHCLIRS
jgi:hypothetical protein